MSALSFSLSTFVIPCHLAKPVITHACVTFMQQLMPHLENRLLIVMLRLQTAAEAERLTTPNRAFGARDQPAAERSMMHNSRRPSSGSLSLTERHGAPLRAGPATAPDSK